MCGLIFNSRAWSSLVLSTPYRSTMLDLVASSGEVADCNQLSTPSPKLYNSKIAKGSLLFQCLVCLFWDTVENGQCNMMDSMEKDQAPSNLTSLWNQCDIVAKPCNYIITWCTGAKSCTGLILQTRTRPYPSYLKLHPTRFPTVVQITFRTQANLL